MNGPRVDQLLNNSVYEPACPLQRSLRQCRKSLENVSRGLRPRNPEKSREQSEKTLSTISGDSPETSQIVPETFWRVFGFPGPEALGDILETFSAFRARRARETSVRGRLAGKTLCTKSCPGDFVLFFSYQERVQNTAGKKLAKSWTWVANF